MQVVSGMARAGKVVAAVCHGPMGLVEAKDEAGVPIVKGREVRILVHCDVRFLFAGASDSTHDWQLTDCCCPAGEGL